MVPAPVRRCSGKCWAFTLIVSVWLRTVTMYSRRTSRQSPFGSALAEWINTLRGQWLSKPSKPLRPITRYFLALTGSLTFFLIHIFFLFFEGLSDLSGQRNTPFILNAQFANLAIALGIIAVFPAAIIALIASWANERHGPVRLFLTGVILPALTSLIIWISVSRWVDMTTSASSANSP